MSKSLKRVRAEIAARGLTADIRETGNATTAQMAADALGVEVDQIVKSIVFAGQTSGRLYLFLTAGGNRIDPVKAAALAGEALGKADAGTIRAVTGFAIGGVSPLGHKTAIPCFFDPRCRSFAEVWSAAGTPRHVFGAAPEALLAATGAQVADFTTES
jgi:prolyl-tRNA editing enzyme YbaK/EbsC (Cys-tRNA(Pro) deacylase)